MEVSLAAIKSFALSSLGEFARVLGEIQMAGVQERGADGCDAGSCSRREAGDPDGPLLLLCSFAS